MAKKRQQKPDVYDRLHAAFHGLKETELDAAIKEARGNADVWMKRADQLEAVRDALGKFAAAEPKAAERQPRSNRGETSAKVIEALRTLGAGKPRDIAKHAGINARAVSSALLVLKKDNQVVVIDGAYSLPAPAPALAE